MSVKHKASHHRASDVLSSDLEELNENFSQLGTDTKQLVRSALHSGRSGVRAVREKAVEGVQRGISGLKEIGSNSRDSIGERISERPFLSALIALGAGFMVAKWMRRR